MNFPFEEEEKKTEKKPIRRLSKRDKGDKRYPCGKREGARGVPDRMEKELEVNAFINRL